MGNRFAFRPKFFFYCWLIIASFSLFSGSFLFAETLRSFVLADLIRALLFDLLLAAPALFLGEFALFYIIPVAVVLGVSCLVNVFHISTYASVLSPYSIQAIIETTPPEAFEFVTDQVAFWKVLIALGALVLPVWAAKRALAARKAAPMRYSRVVWLVLVIAAAVIGQKAWTKGYRFLSSHQAYMTAWSVDRYLSERSQVAEMADSFDPSVLGEITSAVGDVPQTYVVIVGESANRNHMGIYGYHRQTTPRTEAMRDELLIFPKVISPATHTIPSLKTALRFVDFAADGSGQIPSILDLFNAAGFKTFWLSNQPVVTSMGNILEAITSHSTERAYLNLARDAGKSCTYDGALLPRLEKALADPAQKKVIFLHMLGSHLTYALRYPRDFSHFTSHGDIPDAPWRDASAKGYINAYDNSLRYSDWFVTEVVRTVQARDLNSFVLYFSDHGQDVYDTRKIRGCSERNPTRHMVEVPFILWASEKYKARNADFFRFVESSLDREYCTRSLSWTVAQLARLSFDGMGDEKGLFAEKWVPRKYAMLNGIKYEDMPN